MHKVIPFTALVLACAGSSGPPAPIREQTIVGDFAGDQVLFHADGTGATLDFPCSRVSISSPVHTDGAGAFTLPGSRQRTGGAPPVGGETPTPVRVDGSAWMNDGGTLRLIITQVAEVGTPPSDTAFVFGNRHTTLFLCP